MDAFRTQPSLRRRPSVDTDEPPAAVVGQHLALMRATLPYMREGSHFTLASAAVVHGLPLFHANLERVHVVRTGGGHGEVARFCHFYKTPKEPPQHVVVDGLPVTSLARTAGDLMRRCLFGPALAIADAALRLGASRAELLAEVKTGRGCRTATEAARRADPLAESPYESLVRAQILQGGLPLPELQVDFFDDDGFIGRGDMFWRKHGVVGEFDGEGKYTDYLQPGESEEDVWSQQDWRQGRLHGIDLKVVRLRKAHVHDRDVERSLREVLGDVRVDHGLCPEAHDYRRPRRRR